jgi:hypothetical protein
VHVVVFAERQVEVGRRDRRDRTGIAAVAAGDRRAGGVGGGAVVLGGELDRADVGLEHLAVELAHAGRVVGDDRGVAGGAAGAGEGAAQALGAVFLELERGAVRLTDGQGADDADGQGGETDELGCVLHGL